MMMLFLINIFELVAAIVATIYYPKYRQTTERFFMPFLWFTILVEAIVNIDNYYLRFGGSWVFYNILLITMFLFFIGWFLSILQFQNHKKVAKIFLIIFSISVLADLFLQDFSAELLSYLFGLGALLVTICSVLYFTEIIKSDSTTNPMRSLKSLLAANILCFSCGMVPLMLLMPSINLGGKVYQTILLALNILLYSGYSIGFLWGKLKK